MELAVLQQVGLVDQRPRLVMLGVKEADARGDKVRQRDLVQAGHKEHRALLPRVGHQR